MRDARTGGTRVRVARAVFYSSRKANAAMQGFGNRAVAKIQRVNAAPDAKTALRAAYEWLESELAGIARRRPADADALRWELVEELAQRAAGLPRRGPDTRFTGLGSQRPRLEADGLALAPEGGSRE